MPILDGFEIEIPCPKCGRKTKKSIGWIKTNRQLSCGCGTVINLKTDQFRRETAKAEQLLADFHARVQRMFK